MKDQRPLDEAFERFVLLYQSDEAETPEVFAARYPEGQRAWLVAKGRRHVSTLEVLSHIPQPRKHPVRIGRFRLQRKLGTGGMASVYEAIDEASGTRCALKVLHAHLADSLSHVKRLEIEHTVGSRLQHEHLVELCEFGETDGYYYLVMKQVMQRSLADDLRGLKDAASQGASASDLRVSFAVSTCVAVGSGLAYLHEQGILHRDVKPQNILLGADDAVRLSDYGLARILCNPPHGNSHPGTPMGTPYYMSPEQALARGVDHRTDIYSLGVVLYEILSRHRPFESEDLDQLYYDISFSKVRPPSYYNADIARDIETICLKALQRYPSDRYQSVREFVQDMKRFSSHLAISASRPKLWQRARAGIRRHPAIATGAISALLTLGAFQAWGIRQDRAARIAAMPKLTVYSNTVGAAVYLRAQDLITSGFDDPMFIGRTPLIREACEAGNVRVVVVESDGSFFEATRWLYGTEEVTIDASRRPKTTYLDMLAIDGGEFMGGSEMSHYPFGEYYVEPFLIDRTEVTVAEYQAYLKDTGAARPGWWPDVVPEFWARKPVTGVRWTEARAFAEWAGKRLPTRLEWDRAARGVKGWRYPWGNELVTPVAGMACVGLALDLSRDHRAWSDAYAQVVPDVGSFPRDRSPEGLLDVFGSALEWVDAVAVAPWEDGSVVDLTSRVLMGSSFAEPNSNGLLGSTNWKGGTPTARTDIGFRCAKSQNPVPR